jgi:hypothetical protein
VRLRPALLHTKWAIVACSVGGIHPIFDMEAAPFYDEVIVRAGELLQQVALTGSKWIQWCMRTMRAVQDVRAWGRVALACASAKTP